MIMRRKTALSRIVAALELGPGTASQLTRATGVWSGQFYPIVIEMEGAGAINSVRLPGGARIYRLKGEEIDPRRIR